MIYAAIVFLPLAGALIAGLFGRAIGDRASEVITTSFLMIAAVLSWITFFQVALGHETHEVTLMRWITSGELDVSWSLKIDTLTAVMLVVVTTVSSLVHLYSVGYMHEDDSRPRFFAYLSLFTFAMLTLVTSGNLVQMFFGWEGVGLASYLLIGFWYKKPSANAAAIKAFVVNRVGDFGFALGIFGLFFVFHTVNLDALFAAAPSAVGKTFSFAGHDVDILTTLALLLFMGAMGKSAQFLLHTWLPDAMEGPTPVSALIHAATMVTAGVFMVARLSPIFELAPDALKFVTLIGVDHGVLRRDRRPRAERHQARHRLFDLLAARLHVRRLRHRRLWRRHLPSLHARLLQGAPVPRRRLRHPRHAPRAGHARDGRPPKENPLDVRRHAGRHVRV